MRKWDDEDAEALFEVLSTDVGSADLTPVDRAIVTYAEKLTRTPGEMNADDLEPLRSNGLTDRAIHDLCAIVAYFAFVNRIADGLGLEVESDDR